MAPGPKIDLRQEIALVMTPQLQQAIRLLQLSNLEVAAQAEQNPLLDIEVDSVLPGHEAESSQMTDDAGDGDIPSDGQLWDEDAPPTTRRDEAVSPQRALDQVADNSLGLRDHLVPLTLRDVAEAMDMYESTISRVTATSTWPRRAVRWSSNTSSPRPSRYGRWALPVLGEDPPAHLQPHRG
jgi:DNA-directed RNA polymerase specialized sigma54-like protein